MEGAWLPVVGGASWNGRYFLQGWAGLPEGWIL